jgi:hypothetical protein
MAIRGGWFDRLELDEALRHTSDNRYTTDISAISNIRAVSAGRARRLPGHHGEELEGLRSVPNLMPPIDRCRSRNTHLHVFADVGPSAVGFKVYTSDALTKYRSPQQVANDLAHCLEAIVEERQRLSDVGVDRLQ